MCVTVALLLMAAACSLFQKDIQATQSFTMRMDRGAGMPLQFSVLKDIETVSDEAKQHAGNISAFKINTITYTVTDFSGENAAIISGNLEFAASGSTAFRTLATFQNLDLRALEASQAEVLLPVTDTTVLSELASLMQQGSTITLRLNASTSNNPVAATLVLKFDNVLTVEL